VRIYPPNGRENKRVGERIHKRCNAGRADYEGIGVIAPGALKERSNRCETWGGAGVSEVFNLPHSKRRETPA